VIELRKLQVVEALLVLLTGGSIEVPIKGKALRLDRSPRARHRRKGVLWELVRAVGPLGPNTGKWVKPVNNTQARQAADFPAGRERTREVNHKAARLNARKRAESGAGNYGSRSRLIVPRESRRRSPVRAGE